MDHDQIREADLDRLLARVSTAARTVLDAEIDVARRLREVRHDVSGERPSGPNDPATR
jgi:hypothetical protein